MKTSLGIKTTSTDALPCSPAEKSEIRFPRLCLDLDEKSRDLIKAISKEGTATIEYRVKRISAGDQGYPEGAIGSIDLEILSFEPKGKGVDTEDNTDEMNSDEALADFMGKMKK